MGPKGEPGTQGAGKGTIISIDSMGKQSAQRVKGDLGLVIEKEHQGPAGAKSEQ